MPTSLADYPWKKNFMRLIGLIVAIRFVVGAVAAGQRGYFTQATQTCSSAGTIAVTVMNCNRCEGGLAKAAIAS